MTFDQNFSPKAWFSLRIFFSFPVLLAVVFGPSAAAAQATHFAFISPPSSTAGFYTVAAGSDSITIEVQAQNASNVPVTAFNDNVVAGLYNTATTQLSDPEAVYTSGGTTYVGSLPLSFVNGTANFGVTFMAGCNSEQIVLQDLSATPVTQGTSYPGSLGVTTGAAITVRGFMSQPFFPQDPNFNSGGFPNPPTDDTPLTYTAGGGTDPLLTTGVTYYFDEDYGDIVPAAGGTTGTSGIDYKASCYAYQNYSGGYAAANAGVSTNFYFSASARNIPVTYQVILDYDGSLTDFNNPNPAKDTVLQGTFTAGTGYAIDTTAPVTLSGFQPYQPFMLGSGQVILRVWTGAGDSVTMKYANNTLPADNDSTISYIQVPYSPSNVLPLRSTLTAPSYTATPASPPYVLSGNSPTTLIDTFLNQYSSSITQIIFQIPADPLGANNWVISSVPAPSGQNPGSSTGILQASGTNSGAVTLNFSSSSPVTTNETLPITLVCQSPATTYSWPLSILSATTALGSLAPYDSAAVVVNTLGVPPTVTGLAASATNINNGGGQISLSWNQSVSQSPQGYIITRNPTGGSFPMTLTPASASATVDANANNLTGYTYSIAAYNVVAQSGLTSVGPVTAYNNPNPPGPVTALTGGSTVQLSWAAPVSALGSYPITGYQIYRGTSSGAESTTPIAQVGLVTNYNDTGLTTGNYYYYLSSIDSQYSSGPTQGPHDSGPSTEVTGFPPGNPPTGLGTTLVSSSPSTVRLSWTAPVNVLNSPVTGYLIQRAPNGGSFSNYATVGGGILTLNDNLVTIGSYYVYEVQSIDNKGVLSNPGGPVTGYVGPNPPSSLAQAGGTAAVTITWPTVPVNNGETVVSYDLYQDGVSIANITAGPATLTGIDTSPVQGTNYYYQVSSVDQNGIQSSLTAAVTSALLPLIPQSYAVTVQQTGVSFNMDLNWTAPLSSGNVTAYNARYNTVNSFPGTFIGALPFSPQPVTFSEPVSAAGATFFFWIRAVDPGGVGPTTEVGLQVPPNPPVIGTASSTAATITVNWNARPVTENVSYYTVYRSTNPTSGFVSIGQSATTIFNDGSAVAGTDYYYEITATDPGGGVGFPGGEGLPSGTVESALAPSVPVGLTAVLNSTNDNINLNWTSQAGEPLLTSYTLYRTINGGAPTTLLPAAADTVVSYADTGITTANAGATVLYYLFATNNVGSNSTPEGPVGLQVPPNPPTPVTAAPSSNAVTLNWTANPAAQGVSVYTIYRSALPSGTPTAIGTATPGTASSYTDVGPLTEGVTYAYYLTATNPGGGAGVPGGTSLDSVTINSGLGPPAPTGPVVVGIDTSNDIPVTWASVLVTVPNATAVSLLSGPSSVIGSASATQLAASAVSFYYAAQAPDTTYYYWLETLNTFGPSTPSLPASQLTYPAPTTIVSAVLDADGVSRDLTWDTVGTGDVVSYNIYREQIGGSGFVSVGSVSAAGLTFPVKRTSEVLPGKLYAYEITAVNATGEGTSSNSVTVGVPPDDPVSVTAVSGVTTTAAVSLMWAEPNGSAEGVTGYTVYRGTSVTFSTAVAVTTGLAVTADLDSSGLTAGTTYFYWVEADANDGVESLPTIGSSSVTIAAAAQPNAPTGLTETDGNTSASLVWTAGIATTFPITGYNLYDSPSGGATVKANATPVPGLGFAVTGLTNGVTYTLWAQSVDSHGNLSALSAAVTGYPDVPPGVPGSFAGYSGYNSDEAYWTTSSPGSLPVSYYVVERITLAGPATTYIQVASNQTGYVDSSATNGATFVYAVEAVDSSGVTTGAHASGFTSPVTVVTGQVGINPPSQITAQGGVNQVALKWHDSIGSSSPVTGYSVYRASGGSYSLLTTAPVTTTEPNSYTDSSAVNGTTYYYYFVSLASGTTVVSSNSATVLGTPAPPPAAPTPVANLDGNASVTLDWTAPPAEGAVTMAQYVITQDILPAAATTLAATTGPVTTYTDNTVSNGTTVVYQVMAVNSNGTTGALSAAVTGYPYAPFAPTGFSSIDSASAVTLSWTAPGAPTWSPLGPYALLRTTLAGGSPATFTTASTTYTDSSGTLGQLYLYTLVATDAKGHVSTPAGPVTDGPVNPPAAPATVVAAAGNQQILLDWPASAPVSGAAPVSEYQIIRNAGSGPTTIDTTQTWYLDNNNGTGLADPTTVTYTLQAIDETGNPVGNHISVAVAGGPATTSLTDLNPPTALAATALGPASVELTWTRPNDEGNIVTAYNIYRAGSFTTTLGNPIATIANPPLAPVTMFVDNGVSANSTYYYVITAVYQQGSSQVASPASNHASITTPPLGKAEPKVTVGQMAFDANLVKPMTGQVLGIYFVTPDSGPAQINVYNIYGNPIRALYAVAEAGQQENLTWDCKDRNGNVVASGLYLIEIRGPGLHEVKKVLVVK